ncbi:MAG: hypothetical protein WC365_06080 [Candidatus Babeliales bacterium]
MITTTEKTNQNAIHTNFQALDQCLINTMARELDELEKNPVHGWNLAYPTLFNTLYATTGELCVNLGCTIPYLFIDFQGTQRHQASALLMTDGSKQLHMGADFLRKYLLNQPQENRQKSYNLFRWIIAHELGHFCDLKFNLYGRAFWARRFLFNFAIGGSIGGIIGSLVQPQAWNNTKYFVVASGLLLIITGIVSIILHRKFEYFADKKAVGVVTDVDADDIKNMLTKMTATIRDGITSPFDNLSGYTAQFFACCYKKFKRIQIFVLHPSVDKRIERMRMLRP